VLGIRCLTTGGASAFQMAASRTPFGVIRAKPKKAVSRHSIFVSVRPRPRHVLGAPMGLRALWRC
jgi:hypothetical protein